MPLSLLSGTGKECDHFSRLESRVAFVAAHCEAESHLDFTADSLLIASKRPLR